MPTVSPARMWSSTSRRAYFSEPAWYWKETQSKSMLPSGTSRTGSSGSSRSGASSSTWPMRWALVRERVRRRNTLEIIIREFITWST